jgi:hypothetical protein
MTATKRSAKDTWKRAARIIEAAKKRAIRFGNGDAASRIEEISTAAKYAEPGYSGEFIAFGNWNNISRYDVAPQSGNDLPEKVCKLLERTGFECEWSDEWMTCDCGKAVRTSPDSHSWQRYWAYDESGFKCGDCIKQDPAAYLESIEGNPSHASTIKGVDPEEYGYKPFNGTFATGFHPGQTDDPKRVEAEMKKAGHKRYLFALDHAEQFCLMWKAYYMPEEKDGET